MALRLRRGMEVTCVEGGRVRAVEGLAWVLLAQYNRSCWRLTVRARGMHGADLCGGEAASKTHSLSL